MVGTRPNPCSFPLSFALARGPMTNCGTLPRGFVNQLDVKMRLEKGLAAMRMLGREQTYFVTCWLNMVHQHSIDSYRVRVMCILAFLNEIESVFTLGTEKEKLSLLEEVSEVLVTDPILSVSALRSSSEQFLFQLKDKDQISKKDNLTIKTSMFGYALAELRDSVERHYIDSAFDLLEDVLINGSMAAADEDQRLDLIHRSTGFLLSSLLYAGFSLESLYAIYSQVWVPRRVKPSYRFEWKFKLAKQILTSPPRMYSVVLSLDLVTKPEDICDTIAQVSFSLNPPLALAARQKSNTYLDVKPRRLFASITVSAADPRRAGAIAFDRVNNIVNLLRFEYEQSRIQMPDLFAFVESQREGEGARVYPIPKTVPNPPAVLDGAGATDFIKSVDRLMSESTFSIEGRDRIYSAFRLYRLGLDSSTLENKLLNWWTAVEYLVRGSQSNGSIGPSVVSAMAPVISLTYIPKLLAAIRNILVETGTVVSDVNGASIALRALTLPETFDLFRENDVQRHVLDALSTNPYIHRQTAFLLSDLADPAKIKARLISHDRRLRWQISRIYRSRCDIVHSAARDENTALLCSNLEYYLKTVLHALLRCVRQVPTLSGPKEFFDRRAHIFGGVMADLAASHVDALRSSLEL